MEGIQRLILERPFLQGLIEAAGLLIVLAGWWWDRFEPRRARHWRSAALVFLALTVCGQAAQYFVTTDREYITDMMHDARRAFGSADVPALLAICDERLVIKYADGESVGTDLFRIELRDLFGRFEIHRPWITKMRLDFPGPGEAVAIVSGLATIRQRGGGYEYPFADTWRLELRETLDRWLIISVAAKQSRKSW